MAKLLKIFQPMTVSLPAKVLFDAAKAFTGGYLNIYTDTNLKMVRNKLGLLQS